MTISKLSVKQLLELDWDDVSKLGAKESVSYEKRLRTIASRRLANIKKSGLYSRAAEEYFTDGLPKVSYPKSVQTLSKKHDLTKIRNTSQHNISIYKAFLEHESSTVTSIKAARKRQAVRIFGGDKKGRPKGNFDSLEQERRFWSAYKEFIHMNPAVSLFSTRIQQFLGEETFWRTRDFTANDLEHLLYRVMNGGESRPDIRSDPDWLREVEELL